MKTITFICLILISLCSCSELEQLGKRAANDSMNKVAVNTVRKIQNKVEDKAEKIVDNVTKPSKPYKRISETDSLKTTQ